MSQKDQSIPFEALPLDPSGPRGNAWGRFGPNDELGTLNLLTPELIVEAAREIQTGIRVSLDWPLSMPSYPSFDRNPFKQELVLRHPNCVYDDILTFNSQGSTQWDGFRHYGILLSPLWSSFHWRRKLMANCCLANQKMRRFYNGHTTDEIENSDVIGLHSMNTHARDIT
jgi:hypothetical protein